MTYRAAIALGSNLGDRLSTLRRAVYRLSDLGDVGPVSSLYETAPVGGPQQDPYLNAVTTVITVLDPEDLLSRLQAIEAESGRVRSERWGPRTLDLDIIAVERDGEAVTTATEALTLPHPRALERRFVLEPLAEVWPEAEVGPDLTAATALGRVRDQSVQRLGSDWTERRQGLAFSLVAVQAICIVVFVIVAVATGSVSTVALALGGALVVVGAGVSMWGVAALGDALTPLPEPRPGTAIVAAGPYRLVRHPIYAGIVLAMLGGAVAFRSWPAGLVALVTGVFLWFKARYEESRLRLGVVGYTAYLRRVRGRFLPLPSSGDGATLEGNG